MPIRPRRNFGVCGTARRVPVGSGGSGRYPQSPRTRGNRVLRRDCPYGGSPLGQLSSHGRRPVEVRAQVAYPRWDIPTRRANEAFFPYEHREPSRSFHPIHTILRGYVPGGDCGGDCEAGWLLAGWAPAVNDGTVAPVAVALHPRVFRSGLRASFAEERCNGAAVPIARRDGPAAIEWEASEARRPQWAAIPVPQGR
jgi:hypothetical protein